MEAVQKTYKKVSQLQHVLLRPDTYIGSVSEHEDTMWVLRGESFSCEKINYVPGLYKIFDEILVNAADNFRRDSKMTKIEVKFANDGSISIFNDGKSIPALIHKQHNIYVTELIFGHLLTSSNYSDYHKKLVGGRNGYGAKLTNIFSQKFIVLTADSIRKQKIQIEWRKNMSQMDKPEVTPYSGKDFTKVVFWPDYARFNMKGMTPQIISLLQKRVYDIAGVIPIKVYMNGQLVPIRNFKQYGSLYRKSDNQLINDPQQNTDRWEVLVGKSDGQFQQISFVNGICTTKGGNHVNDVVGQIVEKVIPILKKKAKDIAVKPFQIKSHLAVFINCLIQNPSFDSQTKDTLTTTASKFGSHYQVSDKLIKELLKTGFADRVLAQLRIKQNTKIERELKKVKNNHLIIPKLEDANLAGKAQGCTLILTEGDSAKTLAMSGIQLLGRDRYGVYPLRGKLPNVRELPIGKVMSNEQLSNIVKIMGLKFEKHYQSTQELRYSSVLVMADQDIDGSHIKGLVINFLETFWPSLCMLEGFLKEFITPIIRCSRADQRLDFFSQVEYERWKADSEAGWKIKYYKGLGTSTRSEAKEYFSNLAKHQIQFRYQGQTDQEALQLVFNKGNADARKRWLEAYNPQVCVDPNEKILKIQDFINKELIHFSIYDNIRSIPNCMDGLKPSQRKILYACFKRNLINQIKVAQLTGYVAEHSAYHHGQMSLSSSIIGMAQNYCGSNNLNLLEPIGQFGTRHQKGKDHASARYIFTSLNPLTRYLFNEADDHVVAYLQEENQYIEPRYYLPILPLVLINGCEGIGSGWSTTVHPHKIDDVIALVKERIAKGKQLMGFGIGIGYEGFQGSITLENKGNYLMRGKFQIEGDEVTITQIPISRGIREYKAFLEEKMPGIYNSDPEIEEIKQYHSGDRVCFVLRFVQGKKPAAQDMEKYLRLSSILQESNMTLFNPKGKLRKYDSVADILEDFYQERLRGYEKRKEYLRYKLQREAEILENKIRFIQEVIDGNFIMKESKKVWIQQLLDKNFQSYGKIRRDNSTKKHEEEEDQENFNYMLTMPIWNFCAEKKSEMERIKADLDPIIQYYKTVSPEDLWLKDIEEFQYEWNNHKKGQQKNNRRQTQSNRGTLKRTPTGKKLAQNKNIGQPQKTKKRTTSEGGRINKMSRNLMEQQINGKKKIKSDTKNRKSQKMQEQSFEKHEDKKIQELQNQQENRIQALINKYMPSNGSNNGLSLEQRLKARIEGSQDFYSSYNHALQQQQKEVIKETIKDKDNQLKDLMEYNWKEGRS